VKHIVDVPLKRAVDGSFVETAVKELGPYKRWSRK
jgi:hypothetical protein